ncbi:MAG: SPASM domain-containing protein [SAR324 cluster bacterium]|nr:SPASM domain-containing protein [SAR324 cluster bacterium]
MSFITEFNQHVHDRNLEGVVKTLKTLPERTRTKLNEYSTLPPFKPTRICIELTNRCNLNCPFCLVGQQDLQESVAHDDLNRDTGGMDMDLCRKIIKEASQFGIQEIMLTFQGEPLMFKRQNFIELIKLARQHGLQPIVFTNGLLLDPAFSRAIVKAGLHAMRFSVDGMTQDVYELNRVGGTFEKVYHNMRDMVQIVKEEGSSLQLWWQFIALRNNEHQIDEARDMAKKIGIPFIVKTFAESIPELVPKNPEYHRKHISKTCHDIYRAMWVYWNGDVVPCCYDLDGKERLGNINENTIEEIWNGKKYKNLRKRVNEALIHPENEPELCKGCLKYVAPEKVGIHPELAKIKSYLQQPFLK